MADWRRHVSRMHASQILSLTVAFTAGISLLPVLHWINDLWLAAMAKIFEPFDDLFDQDED